MEYLPPGYIQRIGDERFPRFVIRDCLGHTSARDHWTRQSCFQRPVPYENSTPWR